MSCSSEPGNESVEWSGAFHLHIGLTYAAKVFQRMSPSFPFSLPMVGRCMNIFVIAESRVKAGRGHRIGFLPMVSLPIGLWPCPSCWSSIIQLSPVIIVKFRSTGIRLKDHVS